jgi:hypothetical protein
MRGAWRRGGAGRAIRRRWGVGGHENSWLHFGSPPFHCPYMSVFAMFRSCFYSLVRKALFAICLMAAALHGPSALAQTTVVSAPLVTTSDLSGSSPGIWLGFRFQVGATAQRIHEWSAVFDEPLNPMAVKDGTVTLSLFAVDPLTGFPTGASLASQRLTWGNGVNTYAAADLGAIATTTLNANMPYALVAGGGTGGDINWYNRSADYSFSGGFAPVGNGMTLVGTGYGTGWTTSPGHVLTELKVAPAPVPTPVATTAVPFLGGWALWALGLGLMGGGAWRLRRKIA